MGREIATQFLPAQGQRKGRQLESFLPRLLAVFEHDLRTPGQDGGAGQRAPQPAFAPAFIPDFNVIKHDHLFS
jgi:hypothetical protein